MDSADSDQLSDGKSGIDLSEPDNRPTNPAQEGGNQERRFWPVPWNAYIPGSLLAVIMVALFIPYLATEGMGSWGISSEALRQGQVENVATHMFAHGGILHIVMNLSGLVPLSGLLVARLGNPPIAWGRYLALFFLSGLAGAFAYLLFHPNGTIPMVGASGAIFGLLGLLIRMTPSDGVLIPIRSPEMRKEAAHFVKENFMLFVLLTVPALIDGRGGGVAWEAHLGGFLFGIFIGPYFLPKTISEVQ
jgi:membrane associated rhomboid family serine protease